jgi:hypothetical protein
VTGDPGFADSDADGEPDCIDSDMDADGVADKGAHAADNCPFVHNGSQTDSDADGIGDSCERGSAAPLLTCDAGDVRSKAATAMLHVATDGSESRAVLYASGPAGYSEFVPDPTGTLLPIHPVRVHDTWRWHTEPPLAIDFTAPIAFRHALLADVALRDQSGAIVTDGAGRPLTLRDEEELREVYIELSIENVAGRGDTTHFIGESPCTPP